MATITLDGIPAEREPRRSLLARALDRMAEAQMSRARSIAKPHLLAMNDEELARMGHRRDEINRWPDGARWV